MAADRIARVRRHALRAFSSCVVIIMATNLAACGFAGAYSCGSATHCQKRDGVFVIARSAAVAKIGGREVDYARRRFDSLFGKVEGLGLVVLDPSVTVPRLTRWQASWRLDYDVRPTHLAQAAKSGDAITPSDEARKPLRQREGVLSHEICHAFAHRASGGRPLSQALDEIAATSCESPDMIRSRVARFADRQMEGRSIEWKRFVLMDHPLIGTRQLALAIKRGVKSSGNVTSIEIDADSNLGRQTDVFYSQAATFAAFWRHACPAVPALADLSTALASDPDLARWLAGRESRCGPRTLTAFEAEIRRFALATRPQALADPELKAAGL